MAGHFRVSRGQQFAEPSSLPSIEGGALGMERRRIHFTALTVTIDGAHQVSAVSGGTANGRMLVVMLEKWRKRRR